MPPFLLLAEAGAHPSEARAYRNDAYAEAGRGCIRESRALPLRDGEEAVYTEYTGEGGGGGRGREK